MGIIRFIVRGRKLVTLMRVGVIILAMEIYKILCLLKIQSPLCTRSQVQTHSLSPNAPSSTLEQGDNQLSTQPTPENDQPIAIRKPTRSSNIPAKTINMTFLILSLMNFVTHPSRVLLHLSILYQYPLTGN